MRSFATFAFIATTALVSTAAPASRMPAPLVSRDVAPFPLEWRWAQPTPSGDVLTTLAYGNGIYVAAGVDGALLSSTDRSHWTAEAGPLGAGGDYLDAIYANGLFLVSGFDAADNDHLITSRDGKHWTDHTPAQLAKAKARWLGYGNGVFMAVGSEVLTSRDGANWQEHPIASDNEIASPPVFANGRFVLIGVTAGSEYIYYSTNNGASWSRSPTGFSNAPLASLATNGTGFVALGEETPCFTSICGAVYTSPDGDTWTQQADQGSEAGFSTNALWDGSQYLTVSEDYSLNSTYVFTSPDGITWTQGAATTAGLESGTEHAFIAAPVATGNGYAAVVDAPLSVQFSSDFTNWSTVSAAASSGIDFATVDYVNGRFFAVGNMDSTTAPDGILTSSDGLTWSEVFNDPSGATPLADIAYGNGVYVALGGANVALVSTDGFNWTPAATAPADRISQIAYGAGKFVAGGKTCDLSGDCMSIVYTSTDGNVWTAHTTSSVDSNVIGGLAYTGSRFVAVTMTGGFTEDKTVMTSTDGISWTKESGLTTANGLSFSHLRIYDGTLYAGGYNYLTHTGYLMTSSDGLHWSGGALSAGPYIYDIAIDQGSYFIPLSAVAGIPTVLMSQTGKIWSSPSDGLRTPDLDSVVYAQGKIVLVGKAGTIIVAESGPEAVAGTLDVTEDKAVSGTLAVHKGTDGSAVSFALATNPTHGTVKLTDVSKGEFTYTPESGFVGNDSFSFTVSDGVVASGAASEKIVVSAASGNGGGSGGGGGSFDLLTLGLLLLSRRLRLSGARAG